MGHTNYPEHLAPEFEEGGGVATPFYLWWERVKAEFPAVPEDGAKYWLCEHWSHSYYDWLCTERHFVWSKVCKAEIVLKKSATQKSRRRIGTNFFQVAI